MSLTANDFLEIRAIMHDALIPIEGRLEALENDMKDVYHILSKQQKQINSIAKAVR